MKKSHIGFILFILAACLFIADPAFAQSKSAGDVAQNVQGQFKAFASVITGGVFLAGLGVAAAAAFKFKAHAENPQQTQLRIPLIYAAVAAICIGFASFVMMSGSTLFGNSMETNSTEGFNSLK